MLVLCSFATLFGIVLIASATPIPRRSERFCIRPVLALIIASDCMIFFSFLRLRVATEKWRWLPVFNVLSSPLSFSSAWKGDTGNKSWIRFSWFQRSAFSRQSS
jgi:cell division protein FtsW (lipid II flippase)